MKLIVVTLLLFGLTGSILNAAAQEGGREDRSALQSPGSGNTNSTNDQIEVKTDRFSNVITVTLNPQVIIDTPDHLITMAIETKLGEKTLDDFEKEMIKAYAKFESQSKVPVNFGDREVHFIINGAPLNLGAVDLSINAYAARYGNIKPGFKISKSGVKLLNRSALEQFSKANRIEMRLGSIEPKLSNPLITNLREYAIQVFAQHKLSKERKP